MISKLTFIELVILLSFLLPVEFFQLLAHFVTVCIIACFISYGFHSSNFSNLLCFFATILFHLLTHFHWFCSNSCFLCYRLHHFNFSSLLTSSGDGCYLVLCQYLGYWSRPVSIVWILVIFQAYLGSYEWSISFLSSLS